MCRWGSGKLGRLGHGSDSDEVLPRKVALFSHSTIRPLRYVASCRFLLAFVLVDPHQHTCRCACLLATLEVLSVLLCLLSEKANADTRTTVTYSVAAGESHTAVLRTDGSMVTVGRVTHGRFAEGVCVGERIKQMHHSVEIQNADDWHHFPA